MSPPNKLDKDKPTAYYRNVMVHHSYTKVIITAAILAALF